MDLSNGTFTNVEGFVHEDPDLEVTIDRADLEIIMAGQKIMLYTTQTMIQNTRRKNPRRQLQGLQHLIQCRCHLWEHSLGSWPNCVAQVVDHDC